MVHIAVYTFPFGSHAAPLLSLVAKLAAEAPTATFSFFNTGKSNAAIATTVAACKALGNVNVYEVWDGVPEGYEFEGRPREEIELFLEALPGNLRQAMEAAVAGGSGRVTCVLGDAFMSAAGELAEEMGVPWVSLWTSATFSLLAHFYTESIRRVIGVRPEDVQAKQDDTLDFVPALSPFRVRDLMDGIVTNIDGIFPRMLQQMAETSPRATAIVFNTFDGLESAFLDHVRTIYRQILTIGPFSLLLPPPSQADPYGCLAWLDGINQPASVAYISFGSFLSLPPSELAALAEGLEASDTHFIWSMKDAARTHLPPGFLMRTKERGLVVPWAPQTALLGHPATGAFVTHCGWNSVLESVADGVPMICRPVFVDQTLNARAVTNVWRIGVAAEGGVFTKEGAVRSLNLVLAGEEGKKMRETALALKEMARSSVSAGGSSSNNFAALLKILSASGCSSNK
ncbi:anthocyanidin 3-O-glucosyltransferase 7-like [Aristolochia californica]|uniref:anthocyanidin 3-O-glucosyltransferase 7-like n=1 Tax=Aristolochia californica TaxID=171875 RepID=UPI0035D6B9CA